MRFLIIAGLVCLVSPAAWSCFSWDLNVTGGVNLNSNPSPTITATVKTFPLPGCDYFLTVDYGTSTSYSNRSVKQGSMYSWPYQVYDGSFVQKTLADATSNNDVLEGNFATALSQQTQTKSFQIVLDQTNMYRRFGSYAEPINVRLYSGTRTSATLQLTRTINLSYTAAKLIDLSIVDPASAFSSSDVNQLMDFGTGMTAGSTGNADLLVKYNAGYRIRMSSANGGVMKHQTISGQTIGYTFKYNGTTTTLGSGTSTIETGNGISPTDGLRRPLQAIVGSTTGKATGQYEDVITITVQSNE